MKTKPTLPPSAEWDFRQVDPISLTDAAEHEFARECEKIRVPLVRWLETPLKGKPVRQHIIDALIKRQTQAQKTGEKLPDILDAYFPKGIQQRIFEIGQRLTPQCCCLYESIVQHRPDFPNPWTSQKVKGEWNENFKRVHLRPMDEVFKFTLERAQQWPKGWKDYLETSSRCFSTNEYRLGIDFFANGRLSTVDEIVTDFEKWLRAEVKRTGQKMRTGQNAQIKQAAYPLKCLAALRLRRAGFTYDAAADALQKIAVTKEDAWFIPMFENAPSWTKAIHFAEKIIADFEAGKINF